MPIYSPGDRGFYQVAGDRQLLRPDVAGQYLVTATVATNGGNMILTREFSGGTFLGVSNSCLFCHSGGYLPDMITPWSKTHHAVALTNSLDGWDTDHFTQNCIKCHSTGYDANALAVNGGFDDIQAQTGWVMPTNPVPGNFAAMPAALRAKSNVQCESCHGAGSEHAFALGNTNRISVASSAGDCAQCHDAEPYHVKGAEWANSLHAVATRSPTGEGRASCVRCHAAPGFVDFVDGVPEAQRRTMYEAITCAACHDPHGEESPHILRKVTSVTLMDNITTITNGGTGQLCMNCHMGRRDATNYVETHHRQRSVRYPITVRKPTCSPAPTRSPTVRRFRVRLTTLSSATPASPATCRKLRANALVLRQRGWPYLQTRMERRHDQHDSG